MDRFNEYKALVFSTLERHLQSMEILMNTMNIETEVVFDPMTKHYVFVEVHKTWASVSPRDVHIAEVGLEEALMICRRAMQKWALSKRRDPNLIRVDSDKLILQWGTTYEIERLIDELKTDIIQCRQHLAVLEDSIKQAETRAVNLQQQIAKLDDLP